MLDNNKALSKNIAEISFVWEKSLLTTNIDLYISFRPEIIIINANSRSSRPEIESKLILNSFEPTMTCLKKSRSFLNSFRLVFKQN